MDNPSSENPANFLGGPSFEVPSSLKAKRQVGSSFENVQILSISRGGICIEDKRELKEGTEIHLILQIKDKEMETKGEIAWVQKKGSGFSYGVKFTFLSPEAQEWFNTFVMDWAAEHLAENLDFSSLTAPDQSERRRFARLKIPLHVEVGFHPDTMLIHTQIFDISEGGLCLVSNFELKNDQEVYLRLWLNKEKAVFLTGVIKYCAKKIFEKRQVNFHGVEFHKSEGADEVALFLDAKRVELDMLEMTLDEIMSQGDFPQLP